MSLLGKTMRDFELELQADYHQHQQAMSGDAKPIIKRRTVPSLTVTQANGVLLDVTEHTRPKTLP